ncbi:hypothetical protein G4B88_013149 [Cannabis sativa]|uniref:Uncharacterized protein n=1 Tax=Cannabis sativa TaxID=3483 RepID=A0A7J6I2S2_CANSA|nr:hypothetical protein G4B88_013149 [Cannabis sativa]
MATVPEAMSEAKPTVSLPEQPATYNTRILGQSAKPWVDYAIEQGRLYQKTVEETFDSAVEASRSRLSQILSTSSAHVYQTLDSLQDVKSECGAYENIIFGKIKEGVIVSASNPLLTGGVATGLGVLVLKKPRRFLYHKALRLFLSEETLITRAEGKVRALRQSLDVIKTESEKLECSILYFYMSGHYIPKDTTHAIKKHFQKGAKQAEEELKRGRTKLRQAGKQIQGVISSAYKIERQAGGLKDILSELPRREASQFRSQVSSLASEAKRERNALTKEVTKISNYGISV